jgi:hypothetical protein
MIDEFVGRAHGLEHDEIGMGIEWPHHPGTGLV